MVFPWTLQRYIFREMGKTFLLTAAALTAVLSLGGGLLEMVELGEVTPGQFARLLGLVVPVAAALTLPIAALFSAAATYGRLSADNEFVACRSGGINLHVLFLPTLVLSLLSALVTFVLINFLIPGMVRNLNEFFRADLGVLVTQRLKRPQGITLGGRYRIHADDSIIDQLDNESVSLRHIAFVEVDGDEWVRFGTAEGLHARFERSGSTTRVSGSLTGLSFFDRRAGRFVDLAEQALPGNEVPHLVPEEIKFLNLSELIHCWANPEDWLEVAQAMTSLRIAVARGAVCDMLWHDVRRDKELTLADDHVHFTIRAKEVGLVPRDRGIELTDVTIDEQRQSRRRTYTAARANVETTRGDSLRESGIQIEVYDVEARDSDTTISKTKDVLGPVSLPPELVARIEGLSDDELLAGDTTSVDPEGDPVTEKRAEAIETRLATVREIAATFHQRTAFSVSVFVLVILGAALGIVFRGSHVMVAFGISFVPSLIVIVTIVMGKQMAQNAPTHLVGLLLIWAGITAVALLDLWTLTRVVRR